MVATVNGLDITEEDLAMAVADLDQQFAKLPAEQRRAAALSALIEIRLVAAEAVTKGLDKDPEFQRRVEVPAAARAAQRGGRQGNRRQDHRRGHSQALRHRNRRSPPVNEVHARHILVKTKEEAEAIIKQLDGGADFEKLAKEKSNDPSGKTNGGDLGYFGPGQMVPEFEKAALALDVGAYTKEPVQTQFGWHVIKVEDKRAKQPPAFDAGQGPGPLGAVPRQLFRAGQDAARGGQGRGHRSGAEEGRRRDGRHHLFLRSSAARPDAI